MHGLLPNKLKYQDLGILVTPTASPIGHFHCSNWSKRMDRVTESHRPRPLTVTSTAQKSGASNEAPGHTDHVPSRSLPQPPILTPQFTAIGRRFASGAISAAIKAGEVTVAKGDGKYGLASCQTQIDTAEVDRWRKIRKVGRKARQAGRNSCPLPALKPDEFRRPSMHGSLPQPLWESP